MTEASDDEEWRKRVTAKLRQIPSIVLIDNLRQKLDSSAVAAALTAPFWEDRILGVSEMARLPIRCVWIATGNNPEFSNEMARRIVRIRLDAHVERPWQREGFRHPDLMIWVRANRARLVAACLTLCQAWIAAGRPRGTRTIGSYENWAQVLGGVLEVAGIEGFLGNLDEMMEASDAEGAVWRSFVSAWWDRFGTAEVGTTTSMNWRSSANRRCRLAPAMIGRSEPGSARRSGGCATASFEFDERASGSSRSLRHLQGAQRWRLTIDEKTGADKRSRRSPAMHRSRGTSGTLGNVCPQRSRENSSNIRPRGLVNVGERRERFSNPYTCAGARAPA